MSLLDPLGTKTDCTKRCVKRVEPLLDGTDAGAWPSGQNNPGLNDAGVYAL